MIGNVHHTFRNVRVLINWFSQIAVIVNVHCASTNFPFPFLVRRLAFICGRVAAVNLRWGLQMTGWFAMLACLFTKATKSVRVGKCWPFVSKS